MDSQIRITAFKWLDDLTLRFGDVISRVILEEGFLCQGQRITIIGPKGIWKPKQMDLPISITTTSDSPNDDSLGSDIFCIINIVGLILTIPTMLVYGN